MTIELSKSHFVFLRFESRTVKVTAPIRHRYILNEVRENVEMGLYSIDTALSILSGITSNTEEQASDYDRRRELKQAIRATHRGTMGDPMRPTTR